MAAAKGNRYSGIENRTQIVRDTLRRVAKQNPKRMRAACEALLRRAEDGDIAAFTAFRDTLDGRPMQAIEGTGPAGAIVGKLIIEYVNS